MIVALCRYAGPRCPSEVVSLKWADVDLAAGLMTVTSPKTEHIPGEAYRAMNAVGRAAGATCGAASQGPNGWVNANLRTPFSKLIRRAGLKQWPRVFHNLRASCETDLLAEFPIASVTSWLGHSAAVALKHYAQVRGEDFQRAAFGVSQGGAESGAVNGEAVQSEADPERQKRTGIPEVPYFVEPRGYQSADVRSSPNDPMTLRGFEPRSLP